MATPITKRTASCATLATSRCDRPPPRRSPRHEYCREACSCPMNTIRLTCSIITVFVLSCRRRCRGRRTSRRQGLRRREFFAPPPPAPAARRPRGPTRACPRSCAARRPLRSFTYSVARQRPPFTHGGPETRGAARAGRPAPRRSACCPTSYRSRPPAARARRGRLAWPQRSRVELAAGRGDPTLRRLFTPALRRCHFRVWRPMLPT